MATKIFLWLDKCQFIRSPDRLDGLGSFVKVERKKYDWILLPVITRGPLIDTKAIAAGLQLHCHIWSGLGRFEAIPIVGITPLLSGVFLALKVVLAILSY